MRIVFGTHEYKTLIFAYIESPLNDKSYNTR